MYEGREIFPNAPLVFVTAQLKLAYEPDINQQEARDRFGSIVRTSFPILSVEALESEQLTTESGETTRESIPLLRAMREDRKVSVSLSAQELTIEVLDYVDYETFNDWLELAIKALDECAPRVRVARAGLRYLDEIRVPGVKATRDWKGWIAPEYLGPVDAVPGLGVDGMAGQMMMPTAERSVYVRWGEVEASTVLSRESPLDMSRPEVSRFFVLDVDSSWAPEHALLLDEAELTTRFRALHEPIGVIFMSALTEKVKALFRGKHGD